MVKIAIASGKGGTGKTFVATNIFNTLVKCNRRCLLIDCDAEAPNSVAFFDPELSAKTEVTQQVPVIDINKCTFCGRCQEYCSYNAIFLLPPMKIIRVIEDLCHGCGACTVACNDGAITEKSFPLGLISSFAVNDISGIIEAKMNIGVLSPVSIIKAAIRQINNHPDIVILDAPPGTSCPFIQTVAAADYTIIVTEPTPFGLSDLQQSAETLRTLNKPFGTIINRAGTGNINVYKYLEQEKIPLLLEIPFKKEIAETYSVGKLVSDSDPFFAEQLAEVTVNIFEKYGNSNNQR